MMSSVVLRDSRGDSGKTPILAKRGFIEWNWKLLATKKKNLKRDFSVCQ